jgi:hypothetical protein
MPLTGTHRRHLHLVAVLFPSFELRLLLCRVDVVGTVRWSLEQQRNNNGCCGYDPNGAHERDPLYSAGACDRSKVVARRLSDTSRAAAMTTAPPMLTAFVTPMRVASQPRSNEPHGIMPMNDCV